jgi:hypothetical protein
MDMLRLECWNWLPLRTHPRGLLKIGYAVRKRKNGFAACLGKC